MRNAMLAAALGGLLIASPAAAQSTDRGRTGACTAATPVKLTVVIRGLKNATGTVRVQLYDGAGFLKKGRWIGRVEVPAATRDIAVCIAVPRAGDYGVAVRHDANGNGKSDWNDGGGFSRDPKLSLLRLEPDFDKVAVPVRAGANRITVTMNYRRGFSIGPIG
ncbi:DUF2141 domain-containing protein [Sphingomonas sp. ac-8]|uniref:DUF2141 domain-containing protein n=1 Tax=Sphingomonas sp. ac-8 TaxID=3242977 RepID=UPI003A8102CD